MRVIDNKEENRFEAEVDGYNAIIEYSVQPGILSLNHTEVPEELSGRGIASEMTEKVLLQIELRGLKVIPVCPFTKNYIEKHSEWKSIVANEAKKKKPSQD
ncbi:GNAT family N-acetyltransferase [Aequorivita vladivostokensis]|uniref:Acetyltransferase n=1 Tax=Aequorivita vladivostokensis TaxID=171194 RepID=A0ABR5DHX2_9FLAO|nr:GNAT family N-acetyltransferase [Aequorivita vladivostokensis]KJJ38336.1 acetyltransferase [Aequorivita vladivostokensis]MAB57855.1 N-acetyltransferase [Aequorivita sp.]MBF29683.1 N-acetyltransferase [Aequorivita sp.]|tara:strand:- start:131009 stop:131311 length:303 start_codon:yes stop_codon:yes gene_type:complete